MNKKTKEAILKFFPMKNIIVFESVPDYCDNSYAVYKEFLRRGIDKNYKLIWLAKNKIILNGKETKIINDNTFLNHIIKLYCFFTAKCFICCNRHLGILRDGQISFFLNHGTPLKCVGNYYTFKDSITYSIAASESSKEILVKETKCPENKAVVLGYPRNDELFDRFDLQRLFKTKNKIIAWYPTYRQHKTSKECNYNMNPLPLITNETIAKDLNSYLISCGTVLVIKPHFAQDVNYIKKYNFSNIIFIDDNFFVNNNISSYQFLGNTDALISDYSSVVFDYYLCNKPIALIWNDIELYKENPGLIEGYEKFTSGTFKVNSLDELKEFLHDVSIGKDAHKSEREECNKLCNCSLKNDNTKRTVDFIVDKAKLL